MNRDDPALPRVLRLAPFALLLTLFWSCSHIVILHDPLTAEEHNDLGVTYEQKGELDAAIREYQAALRKRKDFPTARVNLGNAYFSKKDYPRAEQQYSTVVQADSANTDAANNLAMLYLETGKHLDEALRLADRCVRLAPKEPRCHDTLGLIFLKSDNPGRAREEFQRALGLLPEGDSDLRREVESHLHQVP
jgi:tetratricopeptide (TPR) repeat protein